MSVKDGNAKERLDEREQSGVGTSRMWSVTLFASDVIVVDCIPGAEQIFLSKVTLLKQIKSAGKDSFYMICGRVPFGCARKADVRRCRWVETFRQPWASVLVHDSRHVSYRIWTGVCVFGSGRWLQLPLHTPEFSSVNVGQEVGYIECVCGGEVSQVHQVYATIAVSSASFPIRYRPHTRPRPDSLCICYEGESVNRSQMEVKQL
jgi:hypothetical protein